MQTIDERTITIKNEEGDYISLEFNDKGFANMFIRIDDSMIVVPNKYLLSFFELVNLAKDKLANVHISKQLSEEEINDILDREKYYE